MQQVVEAEECDRVIRRKGLEDIQNVSHTREELWQRKINKSKRQLIPRWQTSDQKPTLQDF